MNVHRLTLLVVVGVSAGAGSADASITIATNAARPALRVDAAGNAEVSWSAGGGRQYVLVPPRGRVFPGRRLPGRDVSEADSSFKIAFQRALRRTPDGRFWGLQTWRVGVPGTVELRFSRWRGAPPELTLTARPKRRTELLEGRATFQGRPVTGYYRTPEGDPILLSAFIDCFACAGRAGWTRFTAKRTLSNGRFAVTVPLDRRGSKYRATVPGPNRGTTLAPDASAVTLSSR